MMITDTSCTKMKEVGFNVMNYGKMAYATSFTLEIIHIQKNMLSQGCTEFNTGCCLYLIQSNTSIRFVECIIFTITLPFVRWPSITQRECWCTELHGKERMESLHVLYKKNQRLKISS